MVAELQLLFNSEGEAMITWHSVRMADDRLSTAEKKVAASLNRWQTKHPDRRIVDCRIATGRLPRSRRVYVVGIFSSEEVEQ